MGQSRYFSSVAEPTTLTSAVSSTATTLPLAALTGFPINYPYTIAVDYGTSLEELCDVTSAAGLNVNVTRAVDSTSAAAHSLGAAVRHVSSARDFTEYDTHVNTDDGVHGIANISAVVGTTDVQTLSNKTLVSPVLQNVTAGTGGATSTPLTITGASGQTAPLLTVNETGSTAAFGIDAGGNVSITATDASTPILTGTTAQAAGGLINLSNSAETSSLAIGATGNIVAVQNTGANMLSVTNSNGGASIVTGQLGNTTITNTSGLAGLTVTGTTTNAEGIVVNMPTGVIKPLFQGNVNSVDVFQVDQAGNLLANTITTTTGTNAFGGNTTVTGNLSYSGILNPTQVAYSALVSRSSTTTVTADPNLTLSVIATGTYAIDGMIFYNGAASGTADIKYGLGYTGTSSSSLVTFLAPALGGSITAPAVASGAVNVFTLTSATLGTGTTIGMRLNGTIVITGLGTLSFNWAQNTSNGTALVVENSFIRLTRIV